MKDAQVSMSSSPFPKSTKTSAYGWARGQLKLKGVSLQVDYNITYKRIIKLKIDTR